VSRPDRDGGLISAATRPHLPLARRAVLATALGLLSRSALVPRPGRADEQIRWAEPMPLAARSLLLGGARRGDRVIAVGERGHVLISADGGRTWVQAEVPTRDLLTAVTMVGSDLVWAVGHGPVILRSADGGASWIRQHLPEAALEPLLDVLFADEQLGIAIGAFGRIMTTEDGGDTWRADLIDDREPHANALEGSDQALYIAAEFGTLFRSTDLGRTWTALDVPNGGSFFGILILGDGSLLAYGLRGRLIRSTDGGLSWATIETGSMDTLLAGLLRHDGTVLLGGLHGALLTSRDGGRTFEAKRRPSRQAISAFVDLAPRGILLLGEGGFEVIHDLNDF
jgi:photosystem II stability/assembly factor-like uncharacterized protein